MARPRRDDPQLHDGDLGLPHADASVHDADEPSAELGVIERGGATHERWQHKPTAKGTARIWFYVHERTVFLEQVHTSHPNETK